MYTFVRALYSFPEKSKEQHAINHAALCFRNDEKEGKQLGHRGNLTAKENCDAGSHLSFCYRDNIVALIAITFKCFFSFFLFLCIFHDDPPDIWQSHHNSYYNCTKGASTEAPFRYLPYPL